MRFMTRVATGALCVFFGFSSVLAAQSRMIAIDVGHSLASSGATSARGVPEFQYNRALAKAIGSHLPMNVFLIGADGRMNRLKERSEVAAKKGAAFFLSVHHDSAQPKYFEKWQWEGGAHSRCNRFSGYSLFVSRLNPDFSESLKKASAIGAAMRAKGFRPSGHHAEPIEGENREWADKVNGVYFYDNLAVLKNAPCPAVLLEAGVIVNSDEEAKLRGSRTRLKISEALKQALSKDPAGEGTAVNSDHKRKGKSR